VAADGPLPAQMVAAVPAIRRDALGYLERLTARYGDVVAFPMPRTPVVLVNTPAAARHVLVTHRARWTKDTAQYGALSAVTGQGLLTADGDGWRARRRLAQPAFHHGALEGVAAQAVSAAHRALTRVPAAGGVVDVDDLLLQATLEVVGRSLFGADVAEDGERLVAAVLSALEVVVERVRTPLPLPRWAPSPQRRRLRAAVKELDDACARLVARRRAGARGTAAPGDLLGLLLAAVDAGELDERSVRDEIVTMVIAGHETVASSLTWTLHLLAGAPAEQERLNAEVDAVLGGRDPGWSDLGRLPVARAVVDESLRLYPPAWVLSRRAACDDVVAGVAVPAGTVLVLSPWLLHRRPGSFADPLRFDPSRFLTGAPLEPGAYVPFGAGARLCIGRDFALVEQVLALVTLLRRWRLERLPDHRVAVDALVTLRPRGGLPLRWVPR
jgi:cytochrome P450